MYFNNRSKYIFYPKIFVYKENQKTPEKTYFGMNCFFCHHALFAIASYKSKTASRTWPITIRLYRFILKTLGGDSSSLKSDQKNKYTKNHLENSLPSKPFKHNFLV